MIRIEDLPTVAATHDRWSAHLNARGEFFRARIRDVIAHGGASAQIHRVFPPVVSVSLPMDEWVPVGLPVLAPDGGSYDIEASCEYTAGVWGTLLVSVFVDGIRQNYNIEPPPRMGGQTYPVTITCHASMPIGTPVDIGFFSVGNDNNITIARHTIHMRRLR
jgi:hypothetical protein